MQNAERDRLDREIAEREWREQPIIRANPETEHLAEAIEDYASESESANESANESESRESESWYYIYISFFSELNLSLIHISLLQFDVQLHVL